jgi:hypothetical protein
MIEAVRTSETSVDNHFTRQYNPEDNSEHHTRRRENLKSHMIKYSLNQSMSRVSSGSIVSDYGLDDRGIGVGSPAGAKGFSSNFCVQTGSGAHPASCPVGTGVLSPGVNSAGE